MELISACSLFICPWETVFPQSIASVKQSHVYDNKNIHWNSGIHKELPKGKIPNFLIMNKSWILSYRNSWITLLLLIFIINSPPVNSTQLGEGGNHIALSSYTMNTDSSCPHRMETVRQPSWGRDKGLGQRL